MASQVPAALSLTRTVLRVLIVVNPITGVMILILLVVSVVFDGPFVDHMGGAGDAAVIFGVRLVMVVGVVAVPLNHIILQRLLAIVASAGDGEPFLVENARRLRTIAWALLGLEVLHVLVTAWGHINVDFSITGWIAVLLLFVLAQVFEQGARMRTDLEGTV